MLPSHNADPTRVKPKRKDSSLNPNPVSHTKGGGPDELPVDFIEGQWFHGDIRVHRLGQRRVHVHLTLRAQQGARGQKGGRNGSKGARGAYRRGARGQREQGKIRRPQGLARKAPAVKFFDLHLDTGGTARLEEVQGLGQQLVFPPALVPASEAKEHLELRHSETHHHVLRRRAQKQHGFKKACPAGDMEAEPQGTVPLSPSRVERCAKASVLPLRS